MKSNLERIYTNRDSFDILNNSRYMLVSNPFYLVNRFITKIDNSLTKNYLLNLKDLGIRNNGNCEYTSNYDYLYNIVSSSSDKSDVFALLHVASNDRSKKYSGIITEDGIGYGLNNGLTDYYTSLINGKNYSYPIEAIAAKTIDKVSHKKLAQSYFENNSKLLCNSLNLPEYFILDLLELVDNYHDNYLELMKLYREKFEKERYYHNEVYGKFLKEKNMQLVDLYSKIHNLENDNYLLVDNIYCLLVKIIDFSKVNIEVKKRYIENINNDFINLFEKEEFSYLNNLNNVFEKTQKVKRLIK